jgi:hypothetical protein
MVQGSALFELLLFLIPGQTALDLVLATVFASLRLVKPEITEPLLFGQCEPEWITALNADYVFVVHLGSNPDCGHRVPLRLSVRNTFWPEYLPGLRGLDEGSPRSLDTSLLSRCAFGFYSPTMV